MGFDNECIINMESLPGEYFCPVCRTLIYPTEALQAQCTHLYCKPCLAYTVATTQACPYDGYLVTQSDSKPLMEVNKELADRIGLVLVHCLYYRSGCPWQGSLADCLVHGGPCAYGNSPVVCNRCGLQIVHRQVQDHAQVCPGVQSQESEGADQAQAAQSVAEPTHGAAVGIASQNEWYQQQQQYYDPYAQPPPQHASPYQPLPQQQLPGQQAPAGVPPPNPYYAQPPVPAQQESDQETSRKGHNTRPAPYPGPAPHPYAHSPPAPYPGPAPAGMIRSPSPSSYPLPPYSAPPSSYPGPAPPHYHPPNNPPMDSYSTRPPPPFYPDYPIPPYNNNNNNNGKRNGTVLGCWCRICKVECGTEQGLDVHSQSKDHQNKSMDMILGIKQSILIKRNSKIM